MANAWLTEHSDGWLRETEVTVSSRGWHVHDHLLLFLETNDPADLTELGALAVARWLDSARRAGVAAMPSGQHHEIHYGTRERLLYVTKGLMVQKRDRQEGDGYSAADVLAMYQAGEVEAAGWWAEMEALFSTRRRWRAKGGEAFRRSAAVDPEDDPNIPFSVAWINAALGDPQEPQEAAHEARVHHATPSWWGSWERQEGRPRPTTYRPRRVFYPGER